MLVNEHGEPDEVLDWLEKCSSELLSETQEGIFSPPAKPVIPTIAVSQVSQEELEGIKDLIAIDHVYSKNEVKNNEVMNDEDMQMIHDETILNLFPELA